MLWFLLAFFILACSCLPMTLSSDPKPCNSYSLELACGDIDTKLYRCQDVFEPTNNGTLGRQCIKSGEKCVPAQTTCSVPETFCKHKVDGCEPRLFQKCENTYEVDSGVAFSCGAVRDLPCTTTTACTNIPRVCNPVIMGTNCTDVPYDKCDGASIKSDFGLYNCFSATENYKHVCLQGNLCRIF